MSAVSKFALAVWLGASALLAQSLPPSVQAIGTASIYVQPNQALLAVSVTTSGTTAQDAGQQNADLTVAVMKAITTVLGSSGSIQTVSYSVTPRYNNNGQSQPPNIVGYSATNTIQVTMTDLTLIGRVIDAANQAGATAVGNLSLGLQNPEPSLQQALAAASKQALANAGAIASGLGGKVGTVISAQQGASYTPLTLTGLLAVSGSPTPVQTGPVSVSATVTVTAQLQ